MEASPASISPQALEKKCALVIISSGSQWQWASIIITTAFRGIKTYFSSLE
jgi:hypothetical protein